MSAPLSPSMSSPASAPSRAKDQDDESLVARLSDDEGALRELHRRYAALVFTIASRMVGTTAAEEVVQDVFVTLWKKHATFDPARGTFKSWLMQITRRRALNELRRVRHERARTDESDAIDELETDAVAPDDASWLAHRQQVIRAAVDALPPAQRQALSLAFFEELTHEQVATALGAPVGTTKTRIRLALKHLTPLLVAGLAAAFVVLVLRGRNEERARTEDALRMITASDVTTRRLVAAPAAPKDAHGNYRTRPGADLAILTTSNLPPLAPNETFVAWARVGPDWRRLGAFTLERDGRSLLVLPMPSGQGPVDELRVTRENKRADSTAPTGPTMLEWTLPSDSRP